MTDVAPDRAKFVIFPPVIPYSTLAIACILQWLEPLGLGAFELMDADDANSGQTLTFSY